MPYTMFNKLLSMGYLLLHFRKHVLFICNKQQLVLISLAFVPVPSHTRSQHSQECKHSRWCCFWASWPWPKIDFWNTWLNISMSTVKFGDPSCSRIQDIVYNNRHTEMPLKTILTTNYYNLKW